MPPKMEGRKQPNSRTLRVRHQFGTASRSTKGFCQGDRLWAPYHHQTRRVFFVSRRLLARTAARVFWQHSGLAYWTVGLDKNQ